MKAIAQEHTLGCAVACVASLCDLPYKQTLSLFSKSPEKGYYCKDIVLALRRKNKFYIYAKYKDQKLETRTIVFIRRSKKYPAGHFLLKTNKGWMNSWLNYPCIAPVKAGFQKRLPGAPQWVIAPLLSSKS